MEASVIASEAIASAVCQVLDRMVSRRIQAITGTLDLISKSLADAADELERDWRGALQS